MPNYKITATQEFDVEYIVEAEDETSAWFKLLDLSEEKECWSQIPRSITSAFGETLIEEIP